MAISGRGCFLLALFCSALFLSACDDADSVATDPVVENTDMSFYGIGGVDDYSVAGSYLSSRVAQSRFDWLQAERFLSRTVAQKAGQDVLGRRLMLLALGAGDIDTAEMWAKKLDTTSDTTGLSHFIRLMERVRAGDLVSARKILGTMPSNALSKFATPLLLAWVNAGDQKSVGTSLLIKGSGKPDEKLSAGLSGNGIYAYHRILIADYQDKMDEISGDAAFASVRETITPLSAEQLGDLFLRHKRFDVAAQFYKLARTLNPHLVGITVRVKAAEDKKQTLDPPLVIYPKISSVAQGVSVALFDMASTFYNDQSYESALVFTRMSLGLSPDLEEGKLLIANILANQNRIADSVAMYEKIPDTDQRYFAVQQKIASLKVEQGDDAAAIKTLNALILNGSDPEQKIDYLMQIGDIYRENEDFNRALKAYDTAADLAGAPAKPAHWDLYYARGMTLERLKKWDRAEADLKAALAFQPDHPYIMNYLGYSWADQGLHLEDAMKLLLRAVSIVPDDGYVTDSVGWAYYKMGKYQEAVEYLERAVELLPYDGTVNDHLGDAYAKVGRKREAQFQWQRAINYGEDEAVKGEIQKKLE